MCHIIEEAGDYIDRDQRPQPAATIDGDSGGFALMLPYAAIQAAAPVAKLVHCPVGDAVHALTTWLKRVALLNLANERSV